MGFLKKTVYDKLVAKVNNIDTNEFVLKTKYDIEVPILKRKSIIQEKIPNISGLVKKTGYNDKNTNTKSKIPTISGLATAPLMQLKVRYLMLVI